MGQEEIDEYASALAELVVNSKPIITSLTILAQEIAQGDATAAAAIAALVEKHIRTVRRARMNERLKCFHDSSFTKSSELVSSLPPSPPFVCCLASVFYIL